MEYNVNRKKLVIPEYGRYIHNMIQHCVKIEDREERNRCAQAIIEVMGNLNPHLRDVPDFQHKLWDQLCIMSNFQLEVDFPFEKPTAEKFQTKPKKVGYPEVLRNFRYYGHNIRKMIDVALTWEDDQLREGLIYAIANQMKKSFLRWNKDTVDDKVIFDHLYELSGGKIEIKNPDPLIGVSDIPIDNRNTNKRRKKRKTNERF